MWTKYLSIASVDGVASLANATLGEIRVRAETRQILTEAMAEVEALARAQDLHLAPDVVDSALALTDGFEPSSQLLCSARSPRNELAQPHPQEKTPYGSRDQQQQRSQLGDFENLGYRLAVRVGGFPQFAAIEGCPSSFWDGLFIVAEGLLGTATFPKNGGKHTPHESRRSLIAWLLLDVH